MASGILAIPGPTEVRHSAIALEGKNSMKLKQLVLSIALLGSAGCAHESSILVSGASPGGQRVVSTRRTFMWGIASDATWDPRGQCPSGIAKVDVTSIFSLIGVYASYDLVAWCAAGPPIGQAPSYGQAPGYGQPPTYGQGGGVIVIPR
jgi:hypothetical protein